jgi:hypothetical protein
MESQARGGIKDGLAWFDLEVQESKKRRKEGIMKILTRMLAAIGSVLLLALSLQLVAPKAVHAVVSTLVTVANTAANPVPVHSVDAAPQLQAFEISSECNSAAFSPCGGQLMRVPTGLTAVVQDVSGFCSMANVNGAPAPPPSDVAVTAYGGANIIELNTVFQYANAGNTTYTFGRPVTLYAPSPADPNYPPATIYYETTPQSSSGLCRIAIAGYFIPNNPNSPNLF